MRVCLWVRILAANKKGKTLCMGRVVCGNRVARGRRGKILEMAFRLGSAVRYTRRCACGGASIRMWGAGE
ncbi:hypothetical protein [Bartonella sp. MM73XJBT]|uniref:hypothetical protein n=1 Tax=Bartonella sp. MM73XJBT TaxID=3019095 RepID=UPI002361A706|nr:hypothetical protein [Bartonella sp. MM73XJBT]